MLRSLSDRDDFDLLLRTSRCLGEACCILCLQWIEHGEDKPHVLAEDGKNFADEMEIEDLLFSFIFSAKIFPATGKRHLRPETVWPGKLTALFALAASASREWSISR